MSMLKSLYLIPVLYSAITLCLPFSQTVAIGQEDPACFIINSSGQVRNLNNLCEKKSGTVMNEQQLYEQGFTLAQQGDLQQAANSFSQAIQVNPNFADAYVARGFTRTIIEDTPGAIEDFQKAIDIHRTRGETQKVNQVLDILNHLKQAIKDNEL